MTPWWQRAFQALQEEPGEPGPGGLLRAAASFLSYFYGLGSRSHRQLYEKGWLAGRRLPAPVVSIGNLVVGGTGKTPLTAWLASRYQAAGCRVVILSRGYGGQAAGIQVVSDGRRLLRRPPQAGDEACLLAGKLPGIPVVTGGDRHRAGLRAWEAFHPDLFLLDDGFQHHSLHRDLDVVLLDASRPFGNGRLLPRGPLREPVATLQRPLILVLTRYDDRRHRRTWVDLQAAFPRAVVVRAAFSQTVALRFPGGRRLSLLALSQARLAAVAGLARPEVFAVSLRELGLHLCHFFVFPDHHAFSSREAAALTAAAARQGATGLITTEKDWLRLAPVWPGTMPVYVVPLEVHLLDDWPDHLVSLTCRGEEDSHE